MALRSKRRVGKGAQRCAHVSVSANCDQPWARFALPTLRSLKLMGRIKPSKLELEMIEKQRKMEHYYYHCERNPLGFARLRAENFERDLSEKTREEAAKLAEPVSSARTNLTSIP
jgi:hypothetical protein